MISRIRAIARETDFDFRRFAAPNDPLRHLFDEWVSYYRTKYAIARVLEPRTILEIGVRYGYSAHAFLAAAPAASYVGIDNASATFGGETDALDFARASLAGSAATILELDSQALDSLPGEYYDLIHVDGQQDGDGTFKDLELALEKGRYILVDGYLWSRQNMLSATYFIEKYRGLIESVRVLPGYAGEMLIETKCAPGRPLRLRAEGGHESLRAAYDEDYFLGDCGGHAEFKRSGGRALADPRLVAMFELGNPRAGMRVLDVGCGRGELAYAARAAGAEVVAIDYSASAIAIARHAYRDVANGLEFVETDVLAYEPVGRFDLVFAGDVVEHLAPDSLAAMFERIAGWLAPGGRLVVHTWPNRLAYERTHRDRRQAALAAGSWLPANPRSYYEDLMHINEQTPARLARAIRRSFAHACVFLGDAANPAAGFDREPRVAVATLESIFAVAGDQPIDPERIRAALVQAPLARQCVALIRCEGVRIPALLVAGAAAQASCTLVNGSDVALRSVGPTPVHVSYHWERDGEVVLHDGSRSPIAPPLRPNDRGDYQFAVTAPIAPGAYTLVVSLVQENVFWFDAIDSSHAARAQVTVAGKSQLVKQTVLLEQMP